MLAARNNQPLKLSLSFISFYILSQLPHLIDCHARLNNCTVCSECNHRRSYDTHFRYLLIALKLQRKSEGVVTDSSKRLNKYFRTCMFERLEQIISTRT